MKKRFPYHPFLLWFTLLLLGDCANYKPHYDKTNATNEALPDSPPLHTLYLIGDTGFFETEELPPALQLLEKKLKKAPPSSSVVFLGNTLPEQGMALKSDETAWAIDSAHLSSQLAILRDFPGRIFFLPGESEWKNYGVAGLQRQRKFIERFLDRKDIWLPDCGCSGPEEIELTDNLVLLLVDSQWWLTDWTGQTEINDGCEVKSRHVFKLLFQETVKGNREKNIVVAMHHPVYSAGPHGGFFTFKQHLFPLTDWRKNFYLPLPLAGSLYPFYRTSVGGTQDLAHANYKELRDMMINTGRMNGQLIFAGAHDHSLQYIERDKQLFVVSGAGSRRSATKENTGVQFAYGSYGFAQMDFYPDGTTWLSFWSPEPDSTSGKLLFRKKIKGPLPRQQKAVPTAFPVYDSRESALERPIDASVSPRHGLGRMLWGEHYRSTYQSPLEVPTLRLDTFRGGVVPVKRGGGFQTNSLRLEAPDGRQYTMRSLDKDPSRTVPYPYNRSGFVLNIVEDAFSASHPLSALPIPRMADAVGVYHTNPEMYFIPKQPALGAYNEDFGNALYLVEERPDDESWSEQASFGFPREIFSTPNVIEEIQDDHDHRIDYRSVVRARLFDLLLGDWDRHDDQWRWAQLDSNDQVFYRPIPRDRDQAFSNYDGLMYDIAGRIVPMARSLRPYRGYQPLIQWSNYGARHFDPTFLSGADWSVWESEIHHLQTKLTDEVIEQAFRDSWPEPIYQEAGDKVVALTKERRDNLMRMGRKLYEFRSKNVDIVGTEEKDLFEIIRNEDGSTHVRVYDTNGKGEKEGKFYDRLFLPRETKEIRVYGLQDDDIFIVSGKARSGATLRLVGGLGEDRLTDNSKVSGLSKKTIYYDAKVEESTIEKGRETKAKLSDDPKFNTYNRKAVDYEFDYSRFIPFLGFNPDDGLLIGIAPFFMDYGYKKAPYASMHKFMLQYAFSTSGWAFGYNGEFIDALGAGGDLRIEAVGQTPLYASNFYGLGNDTESLEDTLGEDYHRVRQRVIAFSPAYERKVNSAFRYSFGPLFSSYRIERTGDRLIDELEPELNPTIFEGSDWLGARFVIDLGSKDELAFPTRGLNLHAEAVWNFSLDDGGQNFPGIGGFISGYQQIDAHGKLVFGTRIGGKHIFNNDFEFFQGATLGGIGPRSNFRGFRRDRFTGKSSFYQNIDLRWQIVDSGNRFLPFTVGVYAGFDHGRVWVENDDSNTWHYSYGGGFWLSPLDLINLQFSWFLGDGATSRFAFGGKFFF